MPVALALLAWALRLYRLDVQSFWYDEGYAVYVAGLPLGEMLLWSTRDVVPPLHSYLLSLWLPLSGWSEFGARFLSAWMGTLAVIALAQIGVELHSRRAGWVAGYLAAMSPFYIWHSQDARMYALQMTLGFLATVCLLRAIRRPERWRWWVGMALLNTLALYTQTTGGFQIAFHGLVVGAVGWHQGRRSCLFRGGAALLAALVLWLPWVAYALPFLSQNAGYWPGVLDWRFVVIETLRGFVTGGMMDAAPAQVALMAWGVVTLAGLLALLVRPGRRGLGAALFLSAYLAVPIGLMIGLFHHTPKFSPRYLILASPPLFLLPAMAIVAPLSLSSPPRWLRRVVGPMLCVLLIAFGGYGLHNLYFDPAFFRTDFDSAAQMVREQIAPGEIVLIVPGHMFPAWAFYFGPEGWVALPDDPILDVRHVLHYDNTVERLNPILAQHSGVWLVQWHPRVVDPTGLVPTLLAQVADEVVVAGQPHDMTLRRYRLRPERLPLPPEPVVAPQAGSALNLPLELIGCALPESVAGDVELHAACYWQASAALPEHLSVSARLVDVAGVEWGRADAAISGPDLVAGRWPTGEAILGQYALLPFPGVPPGDFYRLLLMVYQPHDGPQHGVAWAGPVTIGRPAQPFTERLATDRPISGRLGGLVLETAHVSPAEALPGETVQIEAIWRVESPFDPPYLALEGSQATPLLPRADAADAWQPGDRYRTITPMTVSPYAAGGLTTVWAIAGGERVALGVVIVGVTRAFALPDTVEPLVYRLGAAISLSGAEFDFEPGRAASVVLYWRAEAPIDRSYTVFVHLIGPDEQIYGQIDALPLAGRHPTSHWLPGEVVADPYRVELAPGAPPGAYRVVVGLYDLATLDRLPVTDAAANLLPDNAIPIGHFRIEPHE